MLAPAADSDPNSQFLAKGLAWDALQCRGADKVVALVARLCNCGVRAVQSAIGKCEEASAFGLARPSLAKARGVKRRAETAHASDGGAVCQRTADEIDVSNVEALLLDRQTDCNPCTNSIQDICGVRGTCLEGPAVIKNETQHAVAVVVGRLMLWGVVHGVSNKLMEGLLAQLALAKVNLDVNTMGKI